MSIARDHTRYEPRGSFALRFSVHFVVPRAVRYEVRRQLRAFENLPFEPRNLQSFPVLRATATRTFVTLQPLPLAVPRRRSADERIRLPFVNCEVGAPQALPPAAAGALLAAVAGNPPRLPSSPVTGRSGGRSPTSKTSTPRTASTV